MTTATIEQMRARRGLGVFLGLVALASAPLLYAIIRSGMHVENPAMLPWMIALMWVPALASVITRLVLREGFRDVSFRVGGRPGARAIGLAFVAPVIVGLVAYGIAWMTGLAQFIPPVGGWFTGMEPAPLRFGISVIVSMLVGGIVGIVTAAGEEIGWRGYMVTRLVQAGVPAPLVISGLIWGLWHVPAILTGQYGTGPYPLLSALLFLLFAVGMSAFWGTLRLRTGSVWSAVFGHAAWNAVIEGPFTGYTAGTHKALWVGESGILVVLTVCALGYVAWKRLPTETRSTLTEQ
jgi:uncharacterized protein